MVWNSAGETTGMQDKVAIPVSIPIGLSLVPLPGLGDSREAKIAESAPAARVFLGDQRGVSDDSANGSVGIERTIKGVTGVKARRDPCMCPGLVEDSKLEPGDPWGPVARKKLECIPEI